MKLFSQCEFQYFSVDTIYIARFNEFDATGGPVSKELIPKLTVVKKNLSSKLGVALPDIDVKGHFVSLTILLAKQISFFTCSSLSD